MKANEIFYEENGRPRSGWRFAVFAFPFFFFLQFLSGLVGIALFRFWPHLGKPTEYGAHVAVGLLLALFFGWICGKYLENLPFRALGIWFGGGWIQHLVLGGVIGTLSVALAVGIAAVFGNFDLIFNSTATSNDIAGTMSKSLIVFAIAAAFEEVVFRGYILQTFARSGLAWLAIALTSALFAFVHLNNDEAGLFSTLNTALAGVWFGIAYLKTRDLWFVWGLHLMWNWIQGAIFGVEVSGMTWLVQSPLFKESDRGPAWITGENYGIEASIACTVALIVSTIAIYFSPFLKPSEEMLALQKPARE